MKTRKTRKIRRIRKILKIVRDCVACTMLVLFLFSIVALDSATWIPFVTMIVSFAYLMLEAKARGMFYECN